MRNGLLKILGIVALGLALIPGCSRAPEDIIAERTEPIEIIAKKGDTRWSYAEQCICLGDLDPRRVVYEMGQLNTGEPKEGKPYTKLQCKDYSTQ